MKRPPLIRSHIHCGHSRLVGAAGEGEGDTGQKADAAGDGGSRSQWDERRTVELRRHQAFQAGVLLHLRLGRHSRCWHVGGDESPVAFTLVGHR